MIDQESDVQLGKVKVMVINNTDDAQPEPVEPESDDNDENEERAD